MWVEQQAQQVAVEWEAQCLDLPQQLGWQVCPIQEAKSAQDFAEFGWRCQYLLLLYNTPSSSRWQSPPKSWQIGWLALNPQCWMCGPRVQAHQTCNLCVTHVDGYPSTLRILRPPPLRSSSHLTCLVMEWCWVPPLAKTLDCFDGCLPLNWSTVASCGSVHSPYLFNNNVDARTTLIGILSQRIEHPMCNKVNGDYY